MFAHRIQFDVFYENDLAGFRAEDGIVHQFIEILPVTVGQKLKRARRTARSSEQTFASWIFADCLEQIAKCFFHPRELGPAAFGNTSNAALSRLQFRFAVT